MIQGVLSGENGIYMFIHQLHIIEIVVNYLGYIVLLKDSIYYSLKQGGDTDENIHIKGHLKLKVIDTSLGSIDGALPFITKDHKLYMLGSLSNFGFIEERIHHSPIHIPLPELAIKVSIGLHHIMVLSTTGNVYTWGNNKWGQLGLGNLDAEDKPKLVKLPEPIVQIDAGWETSSALSNTGRLYMWGDNSNNQISIDLPEINFSPVEISLGLPINYISIGFKINIAVTNDGVVNKFVSKDASG